MLHYDRIDFSEGIDVNMTSESKDFTAVKVLFLEDLSTDNIISKYFMPFYLISEIIHPR